MSFNSTLNVRCKSDKLESFQAWCEKANIEYQDLVREIIQALPEGRVTIKPSKAKKRALSKLYKGES